MNNALLDFYGFSTQPFSKDIPPKNLLPTSSSANVLGMLAIAVGTEDIVLLFGQLGVGKSVVLRSFLHDLDENHYTSVYIRGPALSPALLYKYILEGLNITPPYSVGAAKMQYFRKIPQLQKKPIILIDDAQDLPDSTLAEIKSLVNFDLDSQNRVTLILTGQTELIRYLKMDHLGALRQRIRLTVEMEPMSCEESARYIDHHTKICGNPKPIFSESAKADIFKTTKGVARKINTICLNTLLQGALGQKSIIDSTDVVYPPLLEQS